MVSVEDPCQDLRRRFVRSFLDITILNMLLGRSLWGYKMMAVLKEKYGVKVGPAVIYPLLDTMEAKELVDSKEIYEGKRRRKVYNSTEKGIDHLRCVQNILREMET
jgi:DNA-binding PadR family transcriptional regulator